MDNQRNLFGFKESRPHLTLKKIVTKERIEEMKALYAKGDMRSTEEKLSDMREQLEYLERRLTNKKT